MIVLFDACLFFKKLVWQGPINLSIYGLRCGRLFLWWFCKLYCTNLANMEPHPLNIPFQTSPVTLGDHAFYTTLTPEPNLTLYFWLEISVEGQALSFSATVKDRNVVILVQNPTFLPQVVSEGTMLVVQTYNNHLWLSTVLHRQWTSYSPNSPSTITQHGRDHSSTH